MRLHPVPISLTLASLVGCTVCGEGTEKEGRECVPVGSVSRDGDEADDGQQADEGDQTRVVTAAGRTVTLRSWEGQVSVPGYSPDRIQLRSLLGGAVAPDAV